MDPFVNQLVNQSISQFDPPQISQLILEPGFSFGGLLHQAISKEIPGASSISVPISAPGSDRFWMLEAIRESMSGIGITHPNPAVGCILVDSQGHEISRGATQAYKGHHAERVAFERVTRSESLAGATAYVTLEPCTHQGHQPACVDLFFTPTGSQIQRIVIASADPHPQVNGEGIRRLRSAGKKVEIGVLGPEATAWNFPFFASQKLKRPAVILKWAQTLDGQMADDLGQSQWISGLISRSYSHWLRQHYDAILVGAKTMLSDLPKLNARDCARPHQGKPLPILFDPHGLCLQADETVQATLKEKTFLKDQPSVFVTHETLLRKYGPAWIGDLEKVLIVPLKSKLTSNRPRSERSPGRSPNPNPEMIPELISLLSTERFTSQLGRPLQSLMVEGGPSTHTAFLKANYADLLTLFIAPILTGGKQNRIALHESLQKDRRFHTASSSRLGPDLLMEMVSQEL